MIPPSRSCTAPCRKKVFGRDRRAYLYGRGRKRENGPLHRIYFCQKSYGPAGNPAWRNRPAVYRYPAENRSQYCRSCFAASYSSDQSILSEAFQTKIGNNISLQAGFERTQADGEWVNRYTSSMRWTIAARLYAEISAIDDTTGGKQIWAKLTKAFSNKERDTKGANHRRSWL